MTQADCRRFLIEALLAEDEQLQEISIPAQSDEQRRLLRALMNVRPPAPIADDVLQVQDEYLRRELAAKGITDIDDLSPISPGIYLWQGDITTLKCDAIVNAANSGMTGCYQPNHNCIDNAIHTFAGMQLRLECDRIMKAQGHLEPTGQAKLTPGYNLPARYILHTVGPIVDGPLTPQHEAELASCYESCLALAAENYLVCRLLLLYLHRRFLLPEPPRRRDRRANRARFSRQGHKRQTRRLQCVQRSRPRDL